jgi:hypothetical protein
MVLSLLLDKADNLMLWGKRDADLCQQSTWECVKLEIVMSI